jgi:hypothetical protein
VGAKSTDLNERCNIPPLMQDHIRIAHLIFNSLKACDGFFYNLKVINPPYVTNEYVFRNSTVTHKTTIQTAFKLRLVRNYQQALFLSINTLTAKEHEIASLKRSSKHINEHKIVIKIQY